MSSLTEINTTMPQEAPDSPIWDSLSKRGHININDDTAKPLHLYYEIFGTGAKKVAFINGMGADRQMWENVVAEFLILGDYQCLVYDHRGSGFSDEGETTFNITTTLLAADLHSMLKAIGWDANINIVGVSMGGMVALEFASNYSQMVNTVTLAVTNAGMTVPPLRGIVDSVRANFINNPLERFEVMCGTLYPESYLKAPAPENTNCKTMLDLCVQRGIRRAKYTKPMSIWSFIGQVGTVFRHYVSPARLENLGSLFPDKQILIVTGDQDHLVRTSNSFFIADKIGRDRVRFEQIENAGHGVTSQHPDRFAKSINTMIEEASR